MAEKLEAHSLTSLAHRLKFLVSRATLRDWVKAGHLRPEAVQSKSSRYLIFTTRKIDGLLSSLEHSFEERITRLARDSQEAVKFRQNAERHALAQIRHNSYRGKAVVREPSPALDDDDARGLTRLTLNPSQDKNSVTVFGGFGAWKTENTKIVERKKT
jgi:hypothetical protein